MHVDGVGGIEDEMRGRGTRLRSASPGHPEVGNLRVERVEDEWWRERLEYHAVRL